MKLYYSTGACSLAPRIVLEELGLPYQSERVDLRNRKTESGKDFRTINAKEVVPALELDNKEVLSECAVILQYLAEQNPSKNLFPKHGTFERYRGQEWLNFIATDLHRNFGVFFRPDTTEEMKTKFRHTVTSKLEHISAHVNGKTFLMGAQFTVADAYLFTILRWSENIGLDLTKWPKIMGYYETIYNRPSVQNALKHEGLLERKSA